MYDLSIGTEAETRTIDRLVRRNGGDPESLASVVECAALGLANGAWRTTCVEDWYAEGRLCDGDMMRINARTTQGIRQRIRGWMIECGLGGAERTDALDAVGPDDVALLSGRVHAWLANPERLLPTGTTLGRLAGADLASYAYDADRVLRAFAVQARTRGVSGGFLRTAAHGAGACRHWWGHPTWPARVHAFVTLLDAPADAFWGAGSAGELRPWSLPEPPQVRDRGALRELLLGRPWELDAASARWVVAAGIGFVRV